MKKTIITIASPETTERHKLKIVGEFYRLQNEAQDFLGLPAISESDFSRQRMNQVALLVDPEKCRTKVGRTLAESLDSCIGPITLTFPNVSQKKRTLNDHEPGTPEHDRLLKIWGIKDEPLTQTWDGWTNYAPFGSWNESPEGYLDRMALKITGGKWANEECVITRAPQAIAS